MNSRGENLLASDRDGSGNYDYDSIKRLLMAATIGASNDEWDYSRHEHLILAWVGGLNYWVNLEGGLYLWHLWVQYLSALKSHDYCAEQGSPMDLAWKEAGIA